MKRNALIVVLVWVLLGLPLAGGAVTVSWDFDSGLDTVNFTYSTNSNVTLDDSGGNLRLTKPAVWYNGDPVQFGRIDANFSLQGDFDVQVDYLINAIPLEKGVQIQLNMIVGTYFAMIRSHEGGGQNYHVWKAPPGSWLGGVSTNDDQGTLRIVRSGNTGYFYFYDTTLSDWNLIYTDSDFGTADRTFYLSAQDNWYVNTTAVSFDVSFDNLKVTAAGLPGYVSPVPLPSSLLLVASGLVALASRLRRRN